MGKQWDRACKAIRRDFFVGSMILVVMFAVDFKVGLVLPPLLTP